MPRFAGERTVPGEPSRPSMAVRIRLFTITILIRKGITSRILVNGQLYQVRVRAYNSVKVQVSGLRPFRARLSMCRPKRNRSLRSFRVRAIWQVRI